MRSGARLPMTVRSTASSGVYIATMFHLNVIGYCRSHRNQIGSACAGSNPAVRECHTMADVPEWLRGLTRMNREKYLNVRDIRRLQINNSVYFTRENADLNKLQHLPQVLEVFTWIPSFSFCPLGGGASHVSDAFGRPTQVKLKGTKPSFDRSNVIRSASNYMGQTEKVR